MPVKFTEEELKKAYKEQFGMDLPQNGKFIHGGIDAALSSVSSTGSPSIEKSEKTSMDQSLKVPEVTKKSGGTVQIIGEDPNILLNRRLPTL